MSFLIYLDYMFNYLFDFDGTLFDSEFAHKQAFQNTFNYFNLGVMPDYSQIMGVKTKDVFSKFTNDENFLQVLCNYKTNFYHSSINIVKPLVNISLLDNLKKNGNKLYIVSGASISSIEKILNFYSCYNLFDGIIASNDYHFSKPSPDPFLTCMRKYKITNNIYGIEDSIQGIKSLNSANITSIGVHNVDIKNYANFFYSDINTYLNLQLLIS